MSAEYLRSGYWVLDGGLASEIERKGFDINKDPLWSARLLHTDPEVIRDIHLSYLKAGASVITTASYQASVEGFCEHLSVSSSDALGLIERSVVLAKAAREAFIRDTFLGGLPPLIAGSVGPYGACQHDGSEYSGNYVDHMTEQELKDWHRPRIATLLGAGVDLLAFETQPALKEAVALVKLLTEYPSARAWVSFSCKDGLHTCHGDLFSTAVEQISQLSAHVLAVGVNCTHPAYITPLLQSAKGSSQLPFIVYPNSGEEWGTTHSWSGEAINLLPYLPSWTALGARLIGGCCRVGTREIEIMSKELRILMEVTKHGAPGTHCQRTAY